MTKPIGNDKHVKFRYKLGIVFSLDIKGGYYINNIRGSIMKKMDSYYVQDIRLEFLTTRNPRIVVCLMCHLEIY
jgi:hypothetical protein